MCVSFRTTLLLSFFIFYVFLHTPYCAGAEEPNSFLTGGTGFEQLTYKEQLPEIELNSSDTHLTNWILFVEIQKSLDDFFWGAKGYFPLSTASSQEYWTREGAIEQTNDLTYRWTRAAAHVGYFLHPLLHPYLGIHWAYSEQERSSFEIGSMPGVIHATATEDVYSFSALFGMKGGFSIASRWSLSYFAEYMLPFYSSITNSLLPGWEASRINGYAYAITGRLLYALNETVSAALQVTGGKQHWEGSGWIQTGTSSAKWPENDTDFRSLSLCLFRYF